MDDEVEAPLDDMEASDDTEVEDDLGDAGRTYTCGAGCGSSIRK